MDNLTELRDLLNKMAEGNRIATKSTDGYLLDSANHLDNQYIFTQKAYKVPVRIEAVAMTDSSNIRIRFGKGQLIFNWERNHDHLRATEPTRGKTCHKLGAGRVSAGEWATFVWIIESSYMKVIVDGVERMHVEGKFSRVASQAGIGPAFRSNMNLTSAI